MMITHRILGILERDGYCSFRVGMLLVLDEHHNIEEWEEKW